MTDLVGKVFGWSCVIAIWVFGIILIISLTYGAARADYVECHAQGSKEDIVSDVRWSHWDGCLWKVDGEWFFVPSERYRFPKYRTLDE